MNWELIDFNKIPGETLINNFFDALSKYRFKQVLVISKDHFILLGDDSGDSTDDFKPKQVNAVVFVSVDGGKTITKHLIGKGSLTEASITGTDIYLVNNEGKSSKLIKASSSFDKWEVVREFENENINNVSFYSATTGLASFFSEEAMKSTIKYTLDGGKSWKDADLNISDGFGTYLFASANEIEYIDNNQLIRADFLNGNRKVLNPKIAPDGYKCDGGYYKDPLTKDPYTYIEKGTLYLKNLATQAVIPLPKGADQMEVYGDYLYALVKEGAYYNYVWSDDKGKSWNTEELRDFFLMTTPIGYYGKGSVFAIVSVFKGAASERGGRFAIRKPD